MRYTSVLLIKSRLPGVSSVGGISNDVYDTYASAAESIVDGKLARRYTVPFSPTPPLVETLSTDIAAYRLWTQRLSPRKGADDEEKTNALKEALALLDELADGTMTLTSSDGSVVSERSTTGHAWSDKMGYNPTYYEGLIENMITDSDKVDDAEDVRDG